MRSRAGTNVMFSVLLVEIDIVGLYRQLAPRGHRVASVDHKIHYDLLNLTRISFDASELRFQHRAQVDVLADHSAEHLFHFCYHRIKVENSWLQHLLPAKGQKLPGQRGRTVSGVLDLFQIAPQRIFWR